jgi:hypothetical protein
MPQEWTKTPESLLAGMPSLLPRLIHTASLKNRDSGTYEEERLSSRFGAAETDRVLRREHVSLFEVWLSPDPGAAGFGNDAVFLETTRRF